MRTGNLSTWLLRGTYPRLYVPIVLIIVLVSTVRYHYLVATETDEVRRHAATELRRAGDALLPSLVALPASDRQAQATLLSEGIASFGPGIHSLKWQVDNSLPPKPGRPACPPPRQTGLPNGSTSLRPRSSSARRCPAAGPPGA